MMRAAARRAATGSLIAVVLVLASPSAGICQDTAWVAALRSGRQLVNQEAYREAEAQFTRVLGLAGVTREASATAHFGRAFAAQQRLLNGDTANGRIDVGA